MSTPIVPSPTRAEEIRRYRESNLAGQASQAPSIDDPRNSPSDSSERWKKARAERRAELDKFDWDPLWRPVEHGLNILFSAGIGVVNTMDKGIGLIKPLEDGETHLGKFGDYLGAFGSGMSASLMNDMDSENYVLGNELIENASDAIGGRFMPDYKDTENNVNPWVKGIGGFALDVALDPITYVPGGVIASGARGAVRAANTVKGFDKLKTGIKGAVKGTEAGDLKFGRWSGAVKPIGWEQWGANRALEKIDRLARKERISPERARWIAPEEMLKGDRTYAEAAKLLNKEGRAELAQFKGNAKGLAAAKKQIRTDWTAKSVEVLGRTVEPLSKNINEFAESRRIGHQAGANRRRLTMEMEKSGASSYLHRGKKERNDVIFKQQQKILAERDMQSVFYASMRNTIKLADETPDPTMAAAYDAVAKGFAAGPYNGTMAEQAMFRLDEVFESDYGVSKFLIDTHRRVLAETDTDFTVLGTTGNEYTLGSIFDAFSMGTDIGLTRDDATVFGRVMAEFLSSAHESRPRAEGPKRGPVPEGPAREPVAPDAPVQPEAPAPAEAAPVAPKLAEETPVPPEAPTVQESPVQPMGPQDKPQLGEQFADDGTSANVAPDVFTPLKEPITVRGVWDEARATIDAQELTKINDELEALAEEIDNMYLTKVDVAEYGRQDSKGKMLPFMGGMANPEKGVLSTMLQKGGVEHVIDTRPIPSVNNGPLKHHDKIPLSLEFKAKGIGYSAIGEVRPDIPRNPAMHLPGTLKIDAALQNADFLQGIDDIIEQIGDAKKVVLLVFEGTGKYNRKQQLVADALTRRGVQAKLVLQKGVVQGKETIDLITDPLIAQGQAATLLQKRLMGNYEGVSPEEGLKAAKTILRASGEKQAQSAMKIRGGDLTSGKKWNNKVQNMTGRRELQSETEIEAGGASREKWVANVKNMLVANTKRHPTKAEAIVQRSNILTNLLSSHQHAHKNLVPKMMAYGGGTGRSELLADGVTAPPHNVERFYRAVFGQTEPLRDSFDTESAKLWDGAQYVVNEHDVVMKVINMLADLEVEIPGYTDKARAIIGGLNDEKILKVSRPLDNDGIRVPQNQLMNAEQTWVAQNYSRAFLDNPDDTTINIFGEVVTGGESGVARNMMFAIEDVGGKYLTDAEAPPLLATQEVVNYWMLDALKKIPTSANDANPNTPVMRGTLSKKHGTDKKHGNKDTPVQGRWEKDLAMTKSPKSDALREELGTPWPHPSDSSNSARKLGMEAEEKTGRELAGPLDDIYDHVTGFATEPIPLLKYEQTLRRIVSNGGTFKMREMAQGALAKIDRKDPDGVFKAWGKYNQVFEKLKKDRDAYANYGVDIFGRVFRDVSPQQAGSTKKLYSFFKDDTDPNFGAKLHKISLKHDFDEAGIIHSDIEAFAKELKEEFGVTRQQELMPFIRATESRRVMNQAREMAETLDANMGTKMADEIAVMRDDPMYAPISMLDKLPDAVKYVVTETILRESITDVRAAANAVDKPAILEWVKNNVARRHLMQYKIVPQVATYSTDEMDRVVRSLMDPNVAIDILNMVKGGYSKSVTEIGEDGLANTVGSGRVSTILTGNAKHADQRKAKKGLGPRDEPEPKATYSTMNERFVYGDDTIPDSGGRSMKSTMDVVRATDMGEAFWLKLGGDQEVRWNPREDHDVNDFVEGVKYLLGLELRQPLNPGDAGYFKHDFTFGARVAWKTRDETSDSESGTIIGEALMAAARRFSGEPGRAPGTPNPLKGTENEIAADNANPEQITGEFLYSHFVEELILGLRSAKTTGIGVEATEDQIREVIINGRPVEGFTASILTKATHTGTPAEWAALTAANPSAMRKATMEDLFNAVEAQNPMRTGSPETARAVMTVIEEKKIAQATLIPSRIREKNVAGIFTENQRQMAIAKSQVSDYTVPNGTAIVAKAEQMGEAGITKYVADMAIASNAMTMKIVSEPLRNLLHNSVADGIQAVVKTADERVRGNIQRGNLNARMREITQGDEVKLHNNIKGTLESKLPHNSVESWNARMMALQQAQATMLRSGIVPITTLGNSGLKGRRYRVDFIKDQHWAYINFTDTYKALIAESTDYNVYLREAIDTRGFPQTLLPELAVYAMTLQRAGVARQERSVLLHDHAKTALTNMAGKGRMGDSVNMFEGESFINGFVSKTVSLLSRDTVATSLNETHLMNGAVALRTAEANSRNILQPVFEKLLAVANDIPRHYGRNHGKDAEKLNDSIDDLRAELIAQGYSADSLEAVVSKAALQKRQVTDFTAMDINAARTMYRMNRVTMLAEDGKTPLTKKQVRQKQQKVAAEYRAINEPAMPDRLRTPARASQSFTDTADTQGAKIEANTKKKKFTRAKFVRIEEMRGPANTERANLAAESLDSSRKIVVEEIVTMVQKAIDTDDPELVTMAYEKAINVGEHITKTNEMLQESFRGGRARFEAENAANQQEARRAAGRPTETYDEGVKATSEAERLDLDSQATNINGKGMQSGRMGLQDLKALASGTEVKYDGNANIGEKVVEALVQRVQKRMGDTKGPAAEAWHTRLILATFGTKRYDFISQEADPELRGIATELLKAWRVILDSGESSLFARSGLDTNHLNKSLARGPMGTTMPDGTKMNGKYKQLPENQMGWEIEMMLPQYIDDLMDPLKGGRSGLQVFKGLNYALNDAAKAPTMGATFSANFGHRSFGYLTAREAIDVGGFVQIKSGEGAGSLAKWLDPSQAYPREMVRQMANLQKFLDYDTRFTNPTIQKIVTATDKITSFMKSSLTIWRPGHHVVSAGGDALMNLLDGVVNPYRYYQAMRIMRANGQFHKGTIFGRDKGAEFGRFMGEYDNAVGGAPGIKVQIGGKNRTLSDTGLYKMFDDAGALINNNTAEDLLAIGDEISLSGGTLSKLFRPIVRANRGLGEFSARRDNVLRLAHAIDIIQRRSFRNTQEMQDIVVREIMEWHPTLQSLSGFERKYMRRTFYFYTWMRNAANKVFETIIEDPRYLTVVPKANVGISVGMGGDPQGVGQVMPNDARLPEFAARNLLGPAWYDDDGQIVGITVNSPQLDIFQDLIGKISVDPRATFSQNLTENAMMTLRENTIGFLSPIPKFPGELLTGEEYNEYGMTPIRDWGEHLIDQTGFGIISRSTGRALINENGFLGARTDNEPNPEDQTKKQIQTGLNSVTGAKWTEWSKWYKVAARERTERNKRYLENTMDKLLDEG